ncbi:MAG: 2-oxo acid dehydrogenase subunit E2 [Microbacteriaceae bacterium]|nr:2-oxo acid dehydrogenase subunit E2 [Microbacteriaceae bacterium]
MTVKTFALPDLGEGLTESELVAWRVDVGDLVELNQIIAEVETAKALVELPSPFAGEIGRLYVDPGATVQVGAPIVDFEVADVGGGAGEDAGGGGAEAPGAPVGVEREPVLVGYGPPVEGGTPPRRKARPSLAHHAGATSSGAAASVASPAIGSVAIASPAIGSAAIASPAMASPAMASPAMASSEPQPDTDSGAATFPPRRSTPPVRKLAHDLGVDLTTLEGTGEDGLITREDVLEASAGQVRPDAGQAAKAPVTAPAAEAATAPATATEAATEPAPATAERVSVDRAARETRTPIHGVRKLTAEAMVRSAFTAPHATEFLTIDVTPSVELLERLRASRAFAGRRLTMLTIVAKALCIAVGRNPAVNAHWDEQAQEIVRFGYVNLGIAAATPRGLMVPNIKDAESLDLVALAESLEALVETAKAGRTGQDSLTGGTVSVTNIGVFGIDAGTPILNPGEAAILAVGAVRRTPWEYRGEVALRQVCTLSLSFDHRLVDGAEASRFLADIGTILSDPGMLLTMV